MYKLNYSFPQIIYISELFASANIEKIKFKNISLG